MKSNLIILAILSLPFTWIISQGYKVIIGNRVFGKKVTVSNFFADGNFPSTHSATSVTVGIIIIFLLLYMSDKINALILSVCILTIFEVFKTLRDACGHRHRQDNTNKLIINIVKLVIKLISSNKINDYSLLEESHKLENAAQIEASKRVGHKTYEVVGGALLGIISSAYLISIFIDIKWLAIIFPISIFYFWFFIKVIRRLKEKGEK